MEKNPQNSVETMALYKSLMTIDDIDHVFEVTDMYMKICELQTQIFCDVESPHYLVRTYFFMTHGRKNGLEANITSLANFHGISRAAMLRKLRAWEAEGRVKLVKRSKETVVYGNEEGLLKMIEYIKKLQDFFTPAPICRRNNCKAHPFDTNT